MSRRDTILVAALLNVGLLLVLLISALRNREEETPISVQKVEVLPALTQSVETPLDRESLYLSFQEDRPPLLEPIAKDVETPSFIEMKVQKGDMLEKIARQHKTTVAAIMRENEMASSHLKIGQVLKITPCQENPQTPTAKAQAVVLSAVPSSLYTVKTGDNPWTIAVKHHMKVEDLLKLNNISEEKARRLKPGDQIRIR